MLETLIAAFCEGNGLVEQGDFGKSSLKNYHKTTKK